MRRLIITGVVGAAVALFQTASYAAGSEAMAKDAGCLNCHAIDKKKVGPAYKDVSAKYKGKAAADVVTAMKAIAVHKGVVGKTKDDDLKAIVEWILTL
jgi:cytochrome c